ncbi:glycosyltransferase family 2 protein [Clostridium estertheticum]|nr:glycosyltransferase family 2 protein [Clostridium estertheticum]WLC90907.1 glycosyltransferase family 2 protein [Clostridium estertheticum]
MPSYNSERYIRDAIDSVLNQTYQCWELIIIDDCSKDKTFSIIQEYYNDIRVRVYANESNQGISATRNRAISLSNGSWIAFLDSDDMWDKTKLQKQMSFAEQSNAEFLFTGSSFINANGNLYPGILEVPELVTYKKLRTHNIISCSSVVIKKKFFANIKMENDDIAEDYSVWLRILKTGVCAYAINEPLLTYRISRNSKSGNKFKSVKRAYNMFRSLGMNPVSSAFFMSSHIFCSIKKYRRIYKK